VGEERDLRRQYRDGLRVEQSESQVRSHSYPTSRVRSYGPKNCINVNKGFTQSDTVCQFTRAYSQTSEASIRLSKPRSPIWFRAIPGAPIRPQTVPIISQKMDFFTKREWEAQLGPDPPTVETLKSFLQKKSSEASIRLSKPRSPIWFRAIPGAPIRPQTTIIVSIFCNHENLNFDYLFFSITMELLTKLCFSHNRKFSPLPIGGYTL
jgi:hypothetical protein